jgi:hypothetical protein
MLCDARVHFLGAVFSYVSDEITIGAVFIIRS